MTRVTLAHGAGGQAMHALIDEVFITAFGAAMPLEDQARVALDELVGLGDRLAFTTDAYVVSPLEFPGGDIGKLAVCGTINDLAVGGATPLYLSCAVILEEGIELALVERIARSMAASAAAAGVRIVTGDTKVVERGACDKLFITTTGLGVIRRGLELGIGRARVGDLVLVSGTLGDHGATIVTARGELGLDAAIASDCAALHELVAALLDAAPATHCLRDPTRGGLASVLVELARASGVGVEIDESALPVREAVRGVCELLGLDPIYLANEGKLVAVVPPDQAERALAALRGHPLGREAASLGRIVAERPGQVTMRTSFGGLRRVDMLVGDQLPRIC